MKRLLFLLLLLSAPASAQVVSSQADVVRPTSFPTPCTPGDVRSDSTGMVKVCDSGGASWTTLTAGTSNTINAQTGTTYTLTASDNGKIITLSNASAITVTVPAGLGAGFNCILIQIGAGQVTVSASSTTVNHRQSHTKIAGQYGIASLIAYAANVFAFGGDTSA